MNKDQINKNSDVKEKRILFKINFLGSFGPINQNIYLINLLNDQICFNNINFNF